MAKVDITGPKLTRGDKAHAKLMDKLYVLRDGVTHSIDSFTSVHKQTLDADIDFYETICKEQASERAICLEIIKTSEDETKCKKAEDRLKELDRSRDEQIEQHREFLQGERKETHKNTAGSVLVLAAAVGVIFSNKQVRAIGKNLLHIKS